MFVEDYRAIKETAEMIHGGLRELQPDLTIEEICYNLAKGEEENGREKSNLDTCKSGT